MKLWDRIQQGMEAGFDASLAAVHSMTEKAGESIELTRARREKSRYEVQVTRLLAELGNTVYEKLSKERLHDVAEQLGVGDQVKEIAELEAQMVQIDRKIGKEIKKEEEKAK
jgi:hypothetical protein